MMNTRASERREAILKVATDLFYQSGYRTTDVQQIADWLGIGKGTIYRYFVSKEDLFFAAVDRAMLKMEEHIREKIKNEMDDISRIKLAIRSYVQFFRAHPEFIELFVQERAEFRLRDVSSYLAHKAKRDTEWEAIFRRLHVQGKVRCANFERITDFITNFLYGMMFTNVFQANEKVLERRGNEAFDMLLYGILLDNEKRV